MSTIAATTGYINTDEACLQLVEMNLRRPDSKGFDRYMIVTVVRNDKPEDFWLDLGPATQFDRPQVRLITGGKDPNGKLWSEHTVGEAIEWANQLREGPFEQPEMPATSDLINAYHNQPEIRHRHQQRVSTFGYGGTVQRGS